PCQPSVEKVGRQTCVILLGDDVPGRCAGVYDAGGGRILLCQWIEHSSEGGGIGLQAATVLRRAQVVKTKVAHLLKRCGRYSVVQRLVPVGKCHKLTVCKIPGMQYPVTQVFRPFHHAASSRTNTWMSLFSSSMHLTRLIRFSWLVPS